MTTQLATDGSERRRFAEQLFQQALAAVTVSEKLRECFQVEGDTLHVGPGRFDLTCFHRIVVAAIGKAAVPMAEHALAVLHGRHQVGGVIVGVGEWTPPQGVEYLQGGHPAPNAQSLLAAQRLLAAMRSADKDTLVLFLISGGASAMAESPYNASIEPGDLFAFYQQLLHSGLSIGKANTLRKHFSAIKGGRLALAAGMATRCTLLISDVPPQEVDVIGSGPSLPDTSTVAECRKLLAETPSLHPLPPSLERFVPVMPETPKVLSPGRFPSVYHTALSNESLLQAAKHLAQRAGYRVLIDTGCDDWDYRDAAAYLLRRAQDESRNARPLCLLSGGEVTVTINSPAGTGGRNQQWALEIARQIAGRPEYVALSAGSDGIDGNSPAAGAVVDGTTWSRAREAGLNPQRALAHFDAHPLFAQLGDALLTGPTGNNLRDLRAVFVQ